MNRPRPARHAAALLLPALALVEACSDGLTDPGRVEPAAPSFAIVDAAHGGAAGFYFLPPMVPAPSYAGTFDGTREPAVTICVLATGTCDATVATFAGSQVKRDPDAQSYGVNWKTKGAGLDPAKTYRIQVSLGATLLGSADVVVVADGRQGRTSSASGHVAVIDGATLPIRFRIEGGQVPPPPAPGDWEAGDFVTYDQQSWGSLNTPASDLLAAHFGDEYPNGVEIGIPGAGGNSALFTVVESVLDVLPLADTPTPLGNDYLDPDAGSLTSLAGYVLALRLDVDFADAGHLGGTATLRFGDLRACGLTDTPSLNGLTVRQLLAALEQALGGAPSAYTYDQLATLAEQLTESFESGVPTQWAQDRLTDDACAGSWTTGQLLTYNQDSWGTLGTAASSSLIANFFTVYTAGAVEIGLVGAAGNSVFFTSGESILDFLPMSGTPDSLYFDLVDPTATTSAGILAGYVLALQLDVDFSDADLLPGTAALRFGDVRVCALADAPTLNGLTVRQILGTLNAALGGGTTAYSFEQLAELARNLAEAFESGVPSAWAMDHLVDGNCS